MAIAVSVVLVFRESSFARAVVIAVRERTAHRKSDLCQVRVRRSGWSETWGSYDSCHVREKIVGITKRSSV